MLENSPQPGDGWRERAIDHVRFGNSCFGAIVGLLFTGLLGVLIGNVLPVDRFMAGPDVMGIGHAFTGIALIVVCGLLGILVGGIFGSIVGRMSGNQWQPKLRPIKDPDKVPVCILIEMLNDRHPDVRLQAAFALGLR